MKNYKKLYKQEIEKNTIETENGFVIIKKEYFEKAVKVRR